MNRSDAQAAIESFRAVFESSQRLADHGLVILSARVDWKSFGSWVIEASAGGDGPAHSAAWDGRDGSLEIRRDDVPVSRLQFSSSDHALRYSERFLLTNTDTSEPDLRSGGSPQGD